MNLLFAKNKYNGSPETKKHDWKLKRVSLKRIESGMEILNRNINKIEKPYLEEENTWDLVCLVAVLLIIAVYVTGR